MKCSRPRCPNIVDAARRPHRLCRKHWEVAPLPARRVDARPTQEHLAKLLRLQWSYAAISHRTGIARSALRGISKVARVRASTEAAVLAVPLTPHLSKNVLVDATGTRRRIEALAYLGWPVSRIEHRFGRCAGRVGKAIATGWVSTAIAAAVAEVYRELENTRGPSELSRRRALKRGFAGPAAWDDRDIDDPKVQPLSPYSADRRVA